MKKYNKSALAQFLLILFFGSLALICLPGCNNTTVNATVRETWTGGTLTHANDSVKYYNASDTTEGFTATNGTCTFPITYTSGAVTEEACANNAIAAIFFNQAFTKLTDDSKLLSPTFEIGPLGGASDTISLRIYVTDLSGNPRSGYSVQVQQGGVNWGTAVTTNSSGVANYGTGLAQTSTYVVSASGAAGTASVIVSTTPAYHSSGYFTAIGAYIRY